MLNSHVDAGTVDPPDPSMIELLEAIVFIQKKTHTTLSLPSSGISLEEINRILDTAYILKEGKATASNWAIRVQRKEVERFLDSLIRQQANPIKSTWQHTALVLGVPIFLGQVNLFCEKVHITEADIKKVQNAIEVSKDKDEPIPIQLVPVEGYQFELEFPQWLPRAYPKTSLGSQTEQVIRSTNICFYCR